MRTDSLGGLRYAVTHSGCLSMGLRRMVKENIIIYISIQ